jgi:ABC-2 type transport system permease protein
MPSHRLCGRSHTGVAATDAITQSAVTVPAVWTLIAIAATAIGARPEIRLAGWLASRPSV